MLTNLFPNIEDRGIIDRRLKGKVQHERDQDYCRIIMVDEENTVVEYINYKNRSYQPMNRNDVEKLILNILMIRNYQTSNVITRGGVTPI